MTHYLRPSSPPIEIGSLNPLANQDLPLIQNQIQNSGSTL